MKGFKQFIKENKKISIGNPSEHGKPFEIVGIKVIPWKHSDGRTVLFKANNELFTDDEVEKLSSALDNAAYIEYRWNNFIMSDGNHMSGKDPEWVSIVWKNLDDLKRDYLVVSSTLNI